MLGEGSLVPPVRWGDPVSREKGRTQEGSAAGGKALIWAGSKNTGQRQGLLLTGTEAGEDWVWSCRCKGK